jgi:hypothetical protein
MFHFPFQIVLANPGIAHFGQALGIAIQERRVKWRAEWQGRVNRKRTDPSIYVPNLRWI